MKMTVTKDFKNWIEATELFGNDTMIADRLGITEEFVNEARIKTTTFDEFCKLLLHFGVNDITENEDNEAKEMIDKIMMDHEYNKMMEYGTYQCV